MWYENDHDLLPSSRPYHFYSIPSKALNLLGVSENWSGIKISTSNWKRSYSMVYTVRKLLHMSNKNEKLKRQTKETKSLIKTENKNRSRARFKKYHVYYAIYVFKVYRYLYKGTTHVYWLVLRLPESDNFFRTGMSVLENFKTGYPVPGIC